MFGSRFLLSLAAFVAGGLVMFGLVSWDVVDPLYPRRLDVLEMIFYCSMASLPAIFWMAIFFRPRSYQRRF